MTDLNALKNTIETAFEDRANITPAQAPQAVRDAVNTVLGMLDSGTLRVAERRGVAGDAVNVRAAVGDVAGCVAAGRVAVDGEGEGGGGRRGQSMGEPISWNADVTNA